MKRKEDGYAGSEKEDGYAGSEKKDGYAGSESEKRTATQAVKTKRGRLCRQ